MFRLKSALCLMLLSTTLFSETNNESQVTVPRLYLQYRFHSVSDFGTNRVSIIIKPYYGYEKDYIDTRVKFFGQNISKEMETVPKAHKIMTGYMCHGVGTIGCIIGGIGIILGSCIIAMNESKKKADGTYDTSVPVGVPIGFAVVAAGLTLHLTKPIYLHLALKEYNKYAKN